MRPQLSTAVLSCFSYLSMISIVMGQNFFCHRWGFLYSTASVSTFMLARRFAADTWNDSDTEGASVSLRIRDFKPCSNWVTAFSGLFRFRSVRDAANLLFCLWTSLSKNFFFFSSS